MGKQNKKEAYVWLSPSESPLAGEERDTASELNQEPGLDSGFTTLSSSQLRQCEGKDPEGKAARERRASASQGCRQEVMPECASGVEGIREWILSFSSGPNVLD